MKVKSVSAYIGEIYTKYGKNSDFWKGVEGSPRSEHPSEMLLWPVNRYMPYRVEKMLSSDTNHVLRYGCSGQRNPTQIW